MKKNVSIINQHGEHTRKIEYWDWIIGCDATTFFYIKKKNSLIKLGEKKSLSNADIEDFLAFLQTVP